MDAGDDYRRSGPGGSGGAGPAFVFGPNGTQVKSISIIFDEGTNAPSTQDPNGVGLAVIDNIKINGRVITTGIGIEPKPRGFVEGFAKMTARRAVGGSSLGKMRTGPIQEPRSVRQLLCEAAE